MHAQFPSPAPRVSPGARPVPATFAAVAPPQTASSGHAPASPPPPTSSGTGERGQAAGNLAVGARRVQVPVGHLEVPRQARRPEGPGLRPLQTDCGMFELLIAIEIDKNRTRLAAMEAARGARLAWRPAPPSAASVVRR